ncbi:MAG: hypothetical protein SFT81_03960 [Candidatus Caenarcaniphilales bacterium]|nr:hypothetical protein [Candidatus Caenarcaniphilales bacterium]
MPISDANLNLIEVSLIDWIDKIIDKYHLQDLCWCFVLTDRSIDFARLTAQEKDRLKNLKSDRRRQDWLIGREILHKLEPERYHLIKFPHPEISLSHSDGLGLGFQVKEAQGVGVDLQIVRSIRPGLSARLTNPSERSLALSPLQIWNIKEALFKANLSNQKTLIRDYRILEVDCDALTSGRGLWRDFSFEFLQIELGGYFACFAIKLTI